MGSSSCSCFATFVFMRKFTSRWRTARLTSPRKLNVDKKYVESQKENKLLGLAWTLAETEEESSLWWKLIQKVEKERSIRDVEIQKEKEVVRKEGMIPGIPSDHNS